MEKVYCPSCESCLPEGEYRRSLLYEANIQKILNDVYPIQYHTLSFPFVRSKDSEEMAIMTFNNKTKQQAVKTVGIMVDGVILQKYGSGRFTFIPICEDMTHGGEYKERHISGYELITVAGHLLQRNKDDHRCYGEDIPSYGNMTTSFDIVYGKETLIYDMDLQRISELQECGTYISVLMVYDIFLKEFIAKVIRGQDTLEDVKKVCRRYREMELKDE